MVEWEEVFPFFLFAFCSVGSFFARSCCTTVNCWSSESTKEWVHPFRSVGLFLALVCCCDQLFTNGLLPAQREHHRRRGPS